VDCGAALIFCLPTCLLLITPEFSHEGFDMDELPHAATPQPTDLGHGNYGEKVLARPATHLRLHLCPFASRDHHHCRVS
jgi:hypothetical protein